MHQEWTPELEAHRVKLCGDLIRMADKIADEDGMPSETVSLLLDAERGLTLLGDIVTNATNKN